MAGVRDVGGVAGSEMTIARRQGLVQIQATVS